MSGNLGHIAPWTRRIIVLNVLVAILADWMPAWGWGEGLRQTWPFTIEGLWRGEVWRLFTYMWMHAGLYGLLLFHLLFNMMTLYFLGRVVEPVLGGRRFLWIYFGGGLCAVVAYLIDVSLAALLLGSPVDVEQPLVGASGAVCAVFGVFALLAPEARLYLMLIPYPIRAVNAMRGFVWISLGLMVIGWWPEMREHPSWGWLFSVAHSAHLGGLFFGWWAMRRIMRRRI
ncbi:MAG: rhomboid family intramembrane serine protease [Candidatus Methylacidiphilales bacterium]